MAKKKQNAELDLRFANSDVEAQSELPETVNTDPELSAAGVNEDREVVKLDIDYSRVDSDHNKLYDRGSVHTSTRSRMPEKQLFSFAEYRAQDAERTGYSNYSYWKSVWANFIKKKVAVAMGIVFIALLVFNWPDEILSDILNS